MSSNPRSQATIRKAMYMLKQQHGVPVTVHKVTGTSTDYETGITTTTKSKVSVRRACLMPMEVTRGNFVSPFYTQTNKPFVTKGGMGWDDAARLFIFDGRDLPNFGWDLQDYIVYKGQRFDVLAFEEFGDSAGWAVWTTQALDTLNQEQLNVSATSAIDLTDQTEGTTL